MSSNRAAANRPFLPKCVRPGSVAVHGADTGAQLPCGASREVQACDVAGGWAMELWRRGAHELGQAELSVPWLRTPTSR